MSSSTPPPSAPTSLRSFSSFNCGFIFISATIKVTESDRRIHSHRFIFSLGNSGVVAGPVMWDDFIQLTDRGIRYTVISIVICEVFPPKEKKRKKKMLCLHER